MKRLLMTVAAFAMVAAACGTDAGTSSPDAGGGVVAGGSSTDTPIDLEQGDDNEAMAPDVEDDSSGDSEDVALADPEDGADAEDEVPTDVTPAFVAEGPAVPDVVLELDDGSTYVLADAQRPVMFVFWAEW